MPTSSPARMTTDQKQKIRRDHAAATVRQLATVLVEIGSNILDGTERQYYQHGSIGLNNFAAKIERGEVNPRRWEFLTWINEPVDLDSLTTQGSPVLDATFVEKRSSG